MYETRDILNNFSVLCVEDEADVLEELGQFLRRRVKSLHLAKDGKEGLEMFLRHRPDIVITDILMPAMNGLDMAAEIKAAAPDTPVMITTAFNEADFFLRAIEIGIDKYVLKPVEAHKFTGSLGEIAWLLKAKRELQLSATVFNAASEGIIVTDRDNKIIAVNPAFCRITGYCGEEVAGLNPKVLSSGRQDKAFYQAMWADLAKTHCWQGEIWNRRKNGEIYPQYLNITRVVDGGGEPQFHVAVFSDITARKEAEQKLYHLAHYDPLTNLPNRVLLQDRLQQAIIQARRHGHALALLFVDLDRFKYVNDAYGHLLGDLLLQEVAARLQHAVRAGDTVSRIGGDEFVVLLPLLDSPESAGTVARHIVNRLLEPFCLQGQEVEIGCSIGVSLYPSNGEDVDSLMQAADAAMYSVKLAGRNNFRFFHAEMNARLIEKMALENALQQALPKRQFELYYQPLYDLDSKRIEAVEALIRWHHPDASIRLPREFLPLAEETGFIFPLGEWVLQTAITEVKALREYLGVSIKLGVNLSAKQLSLPTFPKQLAKMLEDLQFEPAGLELEISEVVLLNADKLALEVLEQLRELGVGIVVNDFCFGYASLLRLDQLPIDRIKVAPSLVANAMERNKGLAAIQAILAMAKILSLKVTIGNLEDLRQLEFFADQDSLQVQGYYFCEPLPLCRLREHFNQFGPLRAPA